MGDPDRLVGDDCCWPCTVTNAAVAAVIAGVPALAGFLRGDPAVLVVTLAWAVGVLGYTLYRLVSRGYLPGSERIAKRTGLHDRIGPGVSNERSDSGGDDRRERR